MKIKNFSFLICFSLIVAGSFMHSTVNAQPSSLTKEEMIQYTPMWTGERFADGRPKVSDDIIARMRYVSVTEAWGTLTASTDDTARRPMMGRSMSTYNYQYYGGFKQMRDEITICGRAATIQFMPYRPDVNNAIQKNGANAGRTAAQFTWGIDALAKGDCYVANVCEGILDASHVGDNMGTTIWSRSGNGGVIRGTVRDLEGNMAVDKNFNLFVRDFRPESNSANMVIGINGPIQVGYVTVMPGDVVLGKREGVIFIPAHLAQKVVESSEKTRLNDIFAHAGVKEGRFTAAQADGNFTPEMNKEFNKWLLDNADTMGKFFDDPKAAPSPAFIRAYVKEREAMPPRQR
jgi:4-hydroxy-4-methyl-2-oxoglutarate aldolase